MTGSGFHELAAQTLRDARAELASLEDQNRVVRAELDLVRSSKAFQLLSIASHPLWVIRAAWSVMLGWTPVAAIGRLWRQFRWHRTSLGTVAPAGRWRWNGKTRISGEPHEAFVCETDHVLRIRTETGPGARLRAHCAVQPDLWDQWPGPVEFLATVRGASQDQGWHGTASRSLEPPARWQDRRWRPIRIDLPKELSGELNVTLQTRSAARRARKAEVLWGDAVLEWPRARADRRRLIAGALRRLRWSGIGGTLAYALGRQRVEDQAAAYARWVGLHRLDERALARLRSDAAAFSYKPIISIITPVYDTPPDVLAACVDSVKRQAYEGWQFCLADDASTSETTREALRGSQGDPRLSVVTLEHHQNIAAASNAALAQSTGEFVALLDHDDELAPNALAEVVRLLNEHPDADVIYSDEDKLDESGIRCDPSFKPDWSPELFLSYMYTCHLMVVRRRLLEEIGGFRAGFEGAQDYDLLLRLMERTGRIHHVPKVLYHWRKGAGSTASAGTMKPWALEAGRRALEDYATRTGQSAEVLAGPGPGLYRFRRAVRGEPLVSIVIPSTGQPRARGGDLLSRCLRSLGKTRYRRFEVVLAVDRGEMTASARSALTPLPHRIVACDPLVPFNFSRKINQAVRHASGEHIVLFNDDLEVISPDWLTAMLEHSQEASVGAVGAKLLYPDGRLQHVGMLVGVCGLASHAFHQHPGQSPGYAASAIVTRNCSAVSAACLMTQRAVFDEVGGLDEDLPVDFNDVDFCLRLRRAGYRIVFTPYAQLYHHESASFGRRLQDSRELALMRQRWGTALEQDPYYNPNLSRNFSDYRIQL